MAQNPQDSFQSKAQMLPPIHTTLVEPDDPKTVRLELDGMWSFVYERRNKRWICLQSANQTRQIVACVIGGRGIATCRQLWKAIPTRFKQGVYFTDFWEAYQAVIPDERHQAVGKNSGLTAHIERFNNTIRQRLARFVRQTLAFSKSD